MPAQPLRILYTSFDEFPGPKGAATHIDAFARALGAHFGDVLLATPGPTDQPLTPIFPGVRQRVFGCPGATPLGRARTFRAKLAAWLRRESFDVMHFRSIFEGFALTDSAVRRGATLIYEVNGFPSIELKYHYRRVADDRVLLNKLIAQENHCLRAAERIITVSDVNRQHLVERGIPDDRISVIRNGVDPDAFPYQDPPTDTGPLRVAYVGTLATWQGIETLLEALELARKHQPVRLTLMGAASRTRRVELDRLVRRFELHDSVEFRAGGQREDVVRLFHDSHVSVVPLLAVDRNTRQGCSPLKLLESMSTGCPVIASELPVVLELAEPERHFIPAHPGDARNLKNALLAVAADRDGAVARARRARERVERQWTWRQATEQLCRLYAECRQRRIPAAT